MGSYNKIDYLLRPSKQVERKLLIEALFKIAKIDYFISEYTYLGMGSIYYADFILFHKYLLIDDMICVEKDNIPNRMEFNKPYNFIKLIMKPVSAVLPNIDRKKPHLVWLDFDSILSEEELSDIRSCITVLPAGSIFIFTIQSDPRNLIQLLDPLESRELKDNEKNEKIIAALQSLIGTHIEGNIKTKDISRNKLPILYSTALKNFIELNVSKRDSLKYFPLFNFCYADGVQMLTIGGILDSPTKDKSIEESGIYNLDFITKDIFPKHISVPPLTLCEKKLFEKKIIKNPNPLKINLEIDEELIENFIKFYRQYPVYNETLV